MKRRLLSAFIAFVMLFMMVLSPTTLNDFAVVTAQITVEVYDDGVIHINRCNHRRCRTCELEDASEGDVVACFRQREGLNLNAFHLAQLVENGIIPRNVTHLNIQNYGGLITDFTPLAELTNLVWLDLERNDLRDISFMANLTNIRRLDIDHNPNLTDISPLAGMVEMIELDLNDTNIRDLTPLTGMTQLEQLDLKNTPISDISPLAGLTNLWNLELAGTRVTDLTPLLGLTNLFRLDLSRTNITDVSLLSELSVLRFLYLESNPNLSLEQIRTLRTSLPNVSVQYHYMNVPPLPPPPSPCECGDCESCGGIEIIIPICDCHNCYNCGFNGGRFGFGRVTNNAHSDSPVLQDALAILRYLVGLSSVINECDDARAAANITSPGLGNPCVSDALQVLRFCVELPSILDSLS